MEKERKRETYHFVGVLSIEIKMREERRGEEEEMRGGNE